MSTFHEMLTSPAFEGELLYHYTGREGLRAILEAGSMRLNPLDRMNDPRERLEWLADSVVLPPGGVSVELLENQDVVVGQIDLLLRLAARIACLTDDRPRDPNGDALAFFHRGWARARMWEQYARQHAGAVLVFDKNEFIEAMDQERQVLDGDAFSPSPVTYTDRGLSIPIEGHFETIDQIHEAIDDLTSSGHSVGDLFFVKNLDWAAETEFRIVVVYGKEAAAINAGRPLDLPYRHSLRGVVLGEAWDGSDWLLPAAQKRGVAQSLMRCGWENGKPGLYSYLKS